MNLRWIKRKQGSFDVMVLQQLTKEERLSNPDGISFGWVWTDIPTINAEEE